MTTLEAFKLAVQAGGTGNDSYAFTWHTLISDAIIDELLKDPKVMSALQENNPAVALSQNHLRQFANRTASNILKQLLQVEVQA